MLGVLLLAGQIVSAYPPLSPTDAAAILAKSPGLSNRTNLEAPADGPTIVIFGGSPTAGPFGEFPPFAPTAPLGHDWYASVNGWPLPIGATPIVVGRGRPTHVSASRRSRSGGSSR